MSVYPELPASEEAGADARFNEQYEVPTPPDPTLADNKDIQEVILGLVVLQEMSYRPEECDEETCDDDCPCQMYDIIGAMFEIILDGPQKEGAKQHLQEAFERSQGKPRIFH